MRQLGRRQRWRRWRWLSVVAQRPDILSESDDAVAIGVESALDVVRSFRTPFRCAIPRTATTASRIISGYWACPVE